MYLWGHGVAQIIHACVHQHITANTTFSICYKFKLVYGRTASFTRHPVFISSKHSTQNAHGQAMSQVGTARYYDTFVSLITSLLLKHLLTIEGFLLPLGQRRTEFSPKQFCLRVKVPPPNLMNFSTSGWIDEWKHLDHLFLCTDTKLCLNIAVKSIQDQNL